MAGLFQLSACYKDMGKPANSILHGLINKERRNRGLPEVSWSQDLYRMAKEHSNAMARQGRLFHSDRYALAGGENCWGGRYHYRGEEQLARDIIHSWLGSKDGHREWLLNRLVKLAGIGISKSKHGTFAAWTFSA